MGLAAQIIGIGPYSPDLAWALEYPIERYADVGVGTTVVTNVFVACSTDESRAIAEAFGFGVSDLGSHHIDPAQANYAKLTAAFSVKEVQQFLALVQSGFDFYFLPNG